MLLHGLEQGGLGLGRGSVDLVGQQQVGEHRALTEAEAAMVEDHLTDHVRRHEIRGELDPRGLQIHRCRQGLDQQRLGHTGDSFQHDVALGQDGAQHARQHC